jgi:hypothetical protein
MTCSFEVVAARFSEVHFWKIAFLGGTVIACVLNWPIFTGRVPFPADIVLSFPPWASFRSEAPIDVHHGEMGDLVTQMYPWKLFAKSALNRGDFPLWNPDTLLGTPFEAEPQTALLYPPDLLYDMLPVSLAWSLTFLIRTALAFAFTALFVRNLGASRSAALSSGLVFACSAFMVTWQGWPQADSALWLPAMLLAIDHLRSTGGMRSAALVALTFSMPVLAGHPEVAVYAVMFAALYALFRLVWPLDTGPRPAAGRARYLALAATGWGLAIGLAMAQLLPAVEWVGQLVRTLNAPVDFKRPLAEVVAYLSRAAASNPNPLGIPIPEGAVYAGILTLLLVPFAALSRRRSTVAYFSLALLCVAQVVYGVGPIWTLVQNTPVLRGFPNTRMICLLGFGLAVLAGLGLDAIQSRLHSASGKANTGEVVTTSLALLFSGAGIVYLTLRVLALPHPSLALGGVRGAGTSAMLWLVGMVVLALAVTRRLTPTSFTGLACSILAADLLTFAYGHVPFFPTRLIYPEPPVYRELRARDHSTFRIVTLDATSPANLEMVYGLASPDGYDFATREQYRLLSPFTHSINPQILGSFDARSVVTMADRRLDLVNVKYLLATTLNDSAALLAAHSERFRLVYTDDQTCVFENLHVLPRAFLVPLSGAHVATEDAALKMLAQPSFDPTTTVLLDSPMAAPAPSRSPSRSTPTDTRVDSIDVGVNRSRIDVSTVRPSILVFSDLYYPGWRVEVDGQRRQLLRADYAFRAVVLAPGRHQVEFAYAPRSFLIGSFVSLAALGAVATLFLVKGREA